MKKKSNRWLHLLSESAKHSERLHRALIEVMDRLKNANNKIAKLQEKLKTTKGK